MSTNSNKTLPSSSEEESHELKSTLSQPLGVLLRQAGLISSIEIETALRQQNQQYRGKRLGEILTLQGWLKPQTVDFFVKELPNLSTQKSRKPLGQYLKQAALLNQRQIEIILSQQKQTKLKFGELAVNNGWLAQDTVDFFLEYLLNNRSSENSPKVDLTIDFAEKKRQFVAKCFKLLKLKRKNSFALRLIEEIFIWTGGESFLTEKLCQFIANSFMTAGEEAESVENLVQTKIIINWETNEAAEHLAAIKNNLLNNQQYESFRLLKLYQKVLQQQPLDDDEDLERSQLIDLGLVVEYQGKLMVANRIYQSVFNQSWVAQALANTLNNSLAEASSLVVTKPASKAIIHQPKETNERKTNKLRNIFLILLIFAVLATLFSIFRRNIKLGKIFHQCNQLLNQQAYKKAIAEYDRLLSVDSNYYQAWTNRGYALAGLKQYNDMFQSCQTATIIDAQAVYAWNCQGEALHNLQRYSEAVAAFERAIKLNASDPIFFINKSESLLALKQYDESLATIETAIEILEEMEADRGSEKISQELAIALNYRGRGLVRKQQYRDAIASYERALSYSPNYFPAQIGKGIALTKLKEYPAATREFKQILTQEKLSKHQQAATWFYLGKTLCESEQNLAATTAFDAALKLKPDYQAARQARQTCDR